MRYSGTSAKVKANAPSSTPSSFTSPLLPPLSGDGVCSPIRSLLVVLLPEVAVRQVARADHRRRGEGVVRRRRRPGPFQATGGLPGARRADRSVPLGPPPG